jgi:hypothetical protein
MSKVTLAQARRVPIGWLFLLVILALSCKLSSLPGQKMNMFTGTNASDGAAKLKAKLGVDVVKVSHITIHEDEMEIVIQDPLKPKNFDKYTYAKGALTGPEPVQTMVFGNKELSADTMPLFSLDEINLGAVADVCQRVTEHAKVEDGKPELIEIDWQAASFTRTKAENDKRWEDDTAEILRQAREGKLDPMARVRKQASDLAVTWRVYIRGPRVTKDFWIDLKGKIWDYQ